jgi:hypothetical protein
MTQAFHFRAILLTFVFFGLLSTLIAQDFYDIYSVKEIRIEFAQDNWEEILARLKDQGNKKRVTATLKISGVTYDSVGVRYKGNSSYYSVKRSGSPKLPFNIKLNHKIKGQKINGTYNTIKLSNVFRDPSFIRETLAYEVAREYMHASKCNYARLYVNGKYMGLYNSVESVDKGFLKSHFGTKTGDLIKCDPLDIKQAINKTSSSKDCKPGDFAALMYQGKDSICYENNYEFKSDNKWQPLIDLTEKLNTDPENVHNLLEVDQCLWMLAFNNVLVNLDSYSGKLSHNFYLYQDSLGVFHPIVWDMNMAFGGFRYSGASNKPMSNEELIDMSLFLHYKNEKRPLISKLFSVDLYRKMYVAHIKTMLNEYFKSGKYKSRAQQVQSSIDYYVKSDENKLYEYELFKKNINETVPVGKQSIIGIAELMEARTTKLLEHPLMSKNDPKVDMLTHKSTTDSTIVVQVRVDEAENVYLFYKEQALGVTNKVLMYDTGENGDIIADNKTYSVELPKDQVKYYFVVAEGEKTATVFPVKGSNDMKKVD